MSAESVCRPIRLNYFLRIPNVGDKVNPGIVTAITGRATTHAVEVRTPHLVAIGSTMAATTPESIVWGAGVMHPEYGVGTVVGPNIHAVRGKLSHSALRHAGLQLRDIPLGDPGFLAPALLGITKSDSPTHSIGVVPHYVDRRDPTFRRLLEEPGVVDLNVHDDPEHFLRLMSKCDAVISSSLHGLIFAEALGIPNLWLSAGDDIAGGQFKFDDWFSTTAAPQASAHVLKATDTARELATHARLHESIIDVETLTSAFPSERLDEICDTAPRELIPVDICRSRPTPVFLISFNRGTMLERVIASIEQLNRPTEIVVHDNGSTEAATLAVLDRLERSGTRVVRRKAIASPDELNEVNDTVREYFANWAEPCRYIVSDGDIDMAIADPNALDVYDELLNIFRKVESVGPMLKISDIPASYPLYNRVMNRHIEQFWHMQPDITETSFGPVAHIDTGIDTTFAMQRAGDPYRRLKHSLRVYEPYEAQHLDWYIEQIGNDVYSTTSSAAVSHWNNVVEQRNHEHVALEHLKYNVIRRNDAGELEMREEQVLVASCPDFQLGGRIKPFEDASEAQRTARISHTEAKRKDCSTDLERWGSPASHYESWQQLSGRVTRNPNVGITAIWIELNGYEVKRRDIA